MTDSTMSQIRVDAQACPSPHSFWNKIMRQLWELCWLLCFRPSVWFWHAPRRMLLRLFGARVGRGVKIMPSVHIWAPWKLTLGDYASVGEAVDLYSVDTIEIGAHATVSKRAFLCTGSHGIDHPHMPLRTAPIRVGAGAWVCAEVYVHPGVTIGEDAVTGVRSVVLQDVKPGEVVAGNPAQFLRMRTIRRTG